MDDAGKYVLIVYSKSNLGKGTQQSYLGYPVVTKPLAALRRYRHVGKVTVPTALRSWIRPRESACQVYADYVRSMRGDTADYSWMYGRIDPEVDTECWVSLREAIHEDSRDRGVSLTRLKADFLTRREALV